MHISSVAQNKFVGFLPISRKKSNDNIRYTDSLLAMLSITLVTGILIYMYYNSNTH